MSNAILNLNSSRAAFTSAATNLVSMLPGVLPNLTFVVNGTTTTTAQAVAQLQAGLTALAAVTTARAHLEALIAAERATRVEIKEMGESLQLASAVALGPTSEQYATLGFARKKPQTPTAEVKAAAAEKRQLTRAARKTLGKRQRAGIHGEPVTPPAPAPTPSSPAVVK